MLRKYDGLFILPAKLSDDGAEKAMETVKETVAKLGGTAHDTNILGKRHFARPLKKQETGYYVKMQMDIEPESIDALLARLKLNENVFRVQILRADATVAPVAAPEEEEEEKKDDG